MESYIETGKDKDLLVINIEISKLYGYARVSSKEQNLDRQIGVASMAVNLRRYKTAIKI
ncbi:hypothetical protein V1657_15760 (plasmid) [Clostridium perfringens]|uniref:hypothetical protein n=1 Tax=Clostridium perfringens TaxID=1502 RepID=UPI002ECFB3CF|nr:hypothetical protein V1657_15760 [Clostridium perfringens]